MKHFKLAIAVALAVNFASHTEGQVTPGFNTEIPPQIMTPNGVETEHRGTLKFFDSMPDEATVEKFYKNLDRMRGIAAFLDLVPLCPWHRSKGYGVAGGNWPHTGCFRNTGLPTLAYNSTQTSSLKAKP